MHDAECIKIYRLRGPLLVKKNEKRKRKWRGKEWIREESRRNRERRE